MRNLTQIYAQTIVGATGIKIIQTTQLFNITASVGGSHHAANRFLAILASAEERTSLFGILSGMATLGAPGGIYQWVFSLSAISTSLTELMMNVAI